MINTRKCSNIFYRIFKYMNFFNIFMDLKKLAKMENDKDRLELFKNSLLDRINIRIYFIDDSKKSHISIGEILRQLNEYNDSKVNKFIYREFSIIKNQYLTEKKYNWQVLCRYYVIGYSFRFYHYRETYDKFLENAKDLIDIIHKISKVKKESIEFDLYREW